MASEMVRLVVEKSLTRLLAPLLKVFGKLLGSLLVSKQSAIAAVSEEAITDVEQQVEYAFWNYALAYLYAHHCQGKLPIPSFFYNLADLT